MATIHPRRRAVTYGKSKNKPTRGLSPAAADAFSRIAFGDEVRSLGNLGLTPNLTTRSLKTTSVLEKTKRSGKDRAPFQYKSSPSPDFQEQVASPLSQTKDALYDVPSSDDQSRQRSSTRGAVGRKRRKIIPEDKPKESIAALDSVVRPTSAASETGERRMPESRPSQTLFKVSLSNDLAPRVANGGDHIRKPSARPSANLQGKPRRRALPRRQIVGGSKQSGETADFQGSETSDGPPRTTVGTAGSSKMCHDEMPSHVAKPAKGRIVSSERQYRKPSSAKNTPPSELDLDLHGARQLKTGVIAPKTPPRRSKPTKGTTTPHQRGLWSMLLPERTSSDSASGLNLPGLKLDNGMPKAEVREQCSTGLYGVLDESGCVSRKKRLVDSLQHRGATSAIDVVHGYETSTDMSDYEEEETPDYALNLSANSTPKSQGSSTDGATQPMRGHNPSQEKYSASQTVQIIPSLGVKATYARQRSYLTEGDISEVGAFDLPLFEDSATARRSRRGARQDVNMGVQPAQSVPGSLDETLDSHGPVLRSIHELRKVGGNSRLTSEIEALMEDVSDKGSTSLSLRRSRLLELATKLQEPSFRQIFVDLGSDCHMVARVNQSNDLVENLFILASILQLLSAPVSTPTLSRISSPPVVDYLIRFLDMGHDPTSASNARSLNMSRHAHLELKGFCKTFLTSSVWSTRKPEELTAQVLALQCLEYLVRRAREAGCVYDVIPSHALRRITQFLEEPLPNTTSQSLEDPTAEFQLAVSILESCTITNKEDLNKDIWSGRTLGSVLGLLPLLTTRFTDIPETLRSLSLRLYLNLTNNNPVLCESFSRSDVLRSICDIVITHFGSVSRNATTQTLELDSLILSLGSLINLAEWCESVRNSTLDLPGRDINYLDQFLELFMANSKKTAEVYKCTSS